MVDIKTLNRCLQSFKRLPGNQELDIFGMSRAYHVVLGSYDEPEIRTAIQALLYTRSRIYTAEEIQSQIEKNREEGVDTALSPERLAEIRDAQYRMTNAIQRDDWEQARELQALIAFLRGQWRPMPAKEQRERYAKTNPYIEEPRALKLYEQVAALADSEHVSDHHVAKAGQEAISTLLSY